MDAVALAGIKAKLTRAEKHLKTLDDELAAWADKAPYAFRGDVEPETNRWVLWFEPKEPIPIELSITVGDFAHNLRSALDHIAFALVPKANRWRTMFPIFDDAEEFLCAVRVPAKRRKGPLGGLDPDGAAFALIEASQPYAGGNPPDTHHPLRVLADLNNEDKHRAILARSSALSGEPSPEAAPIAEADCEVSEKYTIHVNKPLEHGAEIMYTHITITGPNPRVHVAAEFHFNVVFGKEAVPVHSLTILGQAVVKILHAARQLEG